VIRDAGGIPVLAHPIYLGLTLEELDELVARLVAAGLKGIEAYYVDNTIFDTINLLSWLQSMILLSREEAIFMAGLSPISA